MTPLQALEKAVRVLGGQTALAKVCSTDAARIKQQHVFNWLNRDKKLPEKHAVRVHRATALAGDPVYAWELCPDAFAEGDIAA